MTSVSDKKHSSIALTALIAAILCILGPITLPLGPVPVSLALLGVYLGVYLLGRRLGLVSVLVYLLLGGAGLPVFSGFSGGFGILLGPTGGILLGYLPAAAVAGCFLSHPSRRRQGLGMVLGTLCCYLPGAAWYALQTGTGLLPALAVAVLPFLPADGGKIALALFLGPLLRRRLDRAGLLPRGEKDR